MDPAMFTFLGGYHLQDISISQLKSHVIPYKLEHSHWWKIYFSKKNPLQDLPSSLDAVILTNEKSRIYKGSHEF